MATLPRLPLRPCVPTTLLAIPWYHTYDSSILAPMCASTLASLAIPGIPGWITCPLFLRKASTVCVKLGHRTPPPMPGLRSSPVGLATAPPLMGIPAAISSGSGSRRGMCTSAPGSMAAGDGHVPTAPTPMGAYAHARRAGDLLFLAGARHLVQHLCLCTLHGHSCSRLPDS